MRNELHIGDDLHKLFRRYSRNMAGGKVLGVSGNNIIDGKPFSNSELDRVLKIVPCQISNASKATLLSIRTVILSV